MSILVRFAPAGVDRQQYDDVVRKLEEQGDFPPDGLDIHVCFGRDSDVRVSEIWDSREQFEKFGERLQPTLSDAGINVDEPEIIEVQNIIRR